MKLAQGREKGSRMLTEVLIESHIWLIKRAAPTTSIVITRLTASLGLGPRLLNRFLIKIDGKVSSIRQKHAILKSSWLMMSLLSRFVSVWLRRADLRDLFFCKTNLHIA